MKDCGEHFLVKTKQNKHVCNLCCSCWTCCFRISLWSPMTTRHSNLNLFKATSTSWRCSSYRKHLSVRRNPITSNASSHDCVFKCPQAEHDALLKDQMMLIEAKTSNQQFTQEFQQRTDAMRKRLEDEKIFQAKALKKEQVGKPSTVWTLTAREIIPLW